MFFYNPEYVKTAGWVPDPIHYPLRPEPYAGIVTNQGLPGFIRDAAPEGWGEKVIAYGDGPGLSGMDYLIRSSNIDRAGSLLVGTTRTPSVAGQPARLDRLEDLQEFYRRMCFNAPVGNDDDHPKNHAVLFTKGQWRLSPLFDVVPALDGAPPPRLSMAVGQQGRGISRENLLSHAAHFDFGQEAAAVLDEVAGWEDALKHHYRRLLAPALAELGIRSVGADRLRV